MSLGFLGWRRGPQRGRSGAEADRSPAPPAAPPDRAPLEVLTAGNAAGACVISAPVSGEGRLELLWYLHEQSISTDYHRYGNLGLRAAEPRAPVA